MRVNIVVYCWQKAADVGVRDYDGWSALHHACFGGHLGCVQLLLDNNVPVDTRDKVFTTINTFLFMAVPLY